MKNSTSKHSPVPWTLGESHESMAEVIDADGKLAFTMKPALSVGSCLLLERNRERLVECVNACDGMNERDLRKLYGDNAPLRGYLRNIAPDDPRWADIDIADTNKGRIVACLKFCERLSTEFISDKVVFSESAVEVAVERIV